MDRSTIGGSDIASLYNIEYGCRRKLFYTIKGVPADYPFVGNSQTQRGNDLEELIAQKFKVENKVSVRRRNIPLVHKKYPYLTGHIDRLVNHNEILEIKAPANSFLVENNKIAETYHLQLQHYLNLYGTDVGYFAIFPLSDWTLHTFRIEREQPLINDIEKEAANFWTKHIEGAVEPDRLDDFNDKRCKNCPYRTMCRGVMQTEKDERVDLVDFGHIDNQYASLMDRKSLLDNEIKDIRDVIIKQMEKQDVRRGFTEHYNYVYEVQKRTTVSATKLKKKNLRYIICLVKILSLRYYLSAKKEV